jgi:hypothetical protein
MMGSLFGGFFSLFWETGHQGGLIDARSALRKGRLVTKEGYWRPFSLEGVETGHQGRVLMPVLP